MAGVSIKNMTRSPLGRARSAFSAIAKSELPGWEVSLVFVGPTRAKALNAKLRGKTYVPNVLSYIAGDKSAEIIICPTVAKQQSQSYGLSPKAYILYLFIHGVLHVKGWAHGATMERCEHELLTRYEATYSDRYRHRHLPGKDGRRRGAHR